MIPARVKMVLYDSSEFDCLVDSVGRDANNIENATNSSSKVHEK